MSTILDFELKNNNNNNNNKSDYVAKQSFADLEQSFQY